MIAPDIVSLLDVAGVAVHPREPRAIYADRSPDLEADAYRGRLWEVSLDGESEPRQITFGPRDSRPRFSPDGDRFAFLRAGEGGTAQLHVADDGPGEPRAVTDEPLGVSDFRWTADGRELVYVARQPQHGRYGTTGLPAEAEAPRRISTLKHRSNGVGYTLDRPAQVLVTRIDGGAPRLLTPGITDHTLVDVDGEGVLVIAALHASRDDDLRTDLHRVPIDGSGIECLTRLAEPLSVSAAGRTVDGTLVIAGRVLGEDGRDNMGRGSAIGVVGDGTVTWVTDPVAQDLDAPATSLISDGPGSVLAVQRRGRSSVLVEIGLDGLVCDRTEPCAEIDDLALSADGRLVVVTSGPSSFADVAVVRSGAFQMLTDLSEGLRGRGVTEPVPHSARARDGHPLDGLVLVPDGEGPHPALLVIHGGPFARYTDRLFDEAQVYCAAGYAVVLCNPRGSAGYGQGHARAIRHRLGTVDFGDVIDYLDAALAAFPGLDASRVGVMGGSYGGYLTAWTIAHEHRFAASVIERGWFDPTGFLGTSDIGSWYVDAYIGTTTDDRRRQSPQEAVGAVRTPALIIHSEQDLRCPLSQAENYFQALRRAGVPAEMVVFPGENHELSRSGRPRHRVQRFEAILEWWAKYLPTEANRQRLEPQEES